MFSIFFQNQNINVLLCTKYNQYLSLYTDIFYLMITFSGLRSKVFFNQISRQNISSSRWLEESLRILEILIRSKSSEMIFSLS